MKEVYDAAAVIAGISIVIALTALLPSSLTGNISFLTNNDDLGKIDIHENFVTTADERLLNYAKTGKPEEKNCGLRGCPDCLFNTCFTASISHVDEDKGRVWIINYDNKFKKLRRKGLCYFFIDEQKLINHKILYDIIFERPIGSHGWQASKKPRYSEEWQGWRLFSWRNISAPPIECLSAGIIEKWQVVPSARGEAIEEAKQREKEREEKRLGKKTQQGEFVPATQIETPPPTEEELLDDMVTDLNAAE